MTDTTQVAGVTRGIALGALVLSACAAASASRAPSAALPARSRSSEALPARSRSSEANFQVTGVRGALSPYEVEQVMNARMPAFFRCYEEGRVALSALSGRIALALTVAESGRVRRVAVQSSTLGRREVERCIALAAAQGAFPPPRGGEAEVTVPLEFDAPAGEPEVLQWPDEAAAQVSSAELPALRGACGAFEGEVVVTAYVGAGGAVLSAGVTGLVSEATLDCIADAVRAWPMPDPGEGVVKVRIRLG